MNAGPRSLPELLAGAAARWPDRPALVAAEGRRGLSYGQLFERARSGARRLAAAGLRPHERVGLLLSAGPEWGAAFFALLEAGQVVVPLLPDTSAETLVAVLRHAAARGLVCDERTRPKAEGAGLAGLCCLQADELSSGTSTRATSSATPDALAGDTPGAGREPQADLALIAFTSGSTQRPRAVLLTHGNLLADLAALRAVRTVAPGDAFLSLLPPAHLFELVAGLLGPLSCGACVVYPGAPLPNRLLAALREDGITHAMAVPALLGALYQEVLDECIETGLVPSERRAQTPAETARRLREELDGEARARLVAGVRARIGPTLRTIIVGGAATNPVWADVLAPFGVRLEVGYGLTEAAPVVSLGIAGECPPGSVGRPLPGVEVTVDEHGEILVRGPNVMCGYLGDPEETVLALRDGWLHTGDHGRLDTAGFLFVTGRLKEALVTAAGETLYPDEVEAHYASPAFREAAVAALPGADGNDEPALFVVPDAASDLDPLRAFAALRAAAPARFRLARLVVLDRPLPRTPTGKVIRSRLAAAAEEQEP